MRTFCAVCIPTTENRQKTSPKIAKNHLKNTKSNRISSVAFLFFYLFYKLDTQYYQDYIYFLLVFVKQMQFFVYFL